MDKPLKSNMTHKEWMPELRLSSQPRTLLPCNRY